MRLKRVHLATGRTGGRAVVRRASWKLISASTLAAFAFGYGVASAVHEAAAQPTDGAPRALAALGTGIVDPAVKPYLNPKLLKAVPVGPGPVSKPVQMLLTSAEMTTALHASGIPVVALEAYQHAANILTASDAACHLPWQLLAAIGRVESDNGQFGGAMLLPSGNLTRPIYGIPLDGRPGVALVRDPDGGFARAEGPMQFLPSTWAEYGADGNGDGKKDPQNMFDAALGAADFLCAGGGDMNIPAQEAAAVLRYNDADDYVRVVLALAASYEHGDFATLPAAGAAGNPDNGGASTPGISPSPHAKAPARITKPTQSSTAAPTQSPTAAPTPTPARQPAAPATPAVTGPTETGPTTSGQPSQAPVASATPPYRPGQNVDIGWAPAMRQVVVKLLTAAKATPTQPVRPTHPARQATVAPAVLTVCTTPATPGSCTTDMTTKPAEMQLSGDGAAVVKNITWTNWGSATAQGTGTLYASSCNPSCAEGSNAGYPATIIISGITPAGPGTSAYTLIAVQAPGLPYNMSFTTGLVP